MAIRSGHVHIMADDYPVQSRDGPRRVEAFGRMDQSVVMKRKFVQRAAVRPLVEITHQHSGHIAWARIDGRQ